MAIPRSRARLASSASTRPLRSRSAAVVHPSLARTVGAAASNANHRVSDRGVSLLEATRGRTSRPARHQRLPARQSSSDCRRGCRFADHRLPAVSEAGESGDLALRVAGWPRSNQVRSARAKLVCCSARGDAVADAGEPLDLALHDAPALVGERVPAVGDLEARHRGGVLGHGPHRGLDLEQRCRSAPARPWEGPQRRREAQAGAGRAPLSAASCGRRIPIRRPAEPGRGCRPGEGRVQQVSRCRARGALRRPGPRPHR